MNTVPKFPVWLIIPIALVLVVSTVGMAGERMSVQADIANIRSGPDAEGSILWKVEKYYPVTILEKKGQWVRFQDFEGDKGWIHSSLLSKTRTIIIKVDRCNIREGPGTQFEVAFTVDKGIPFKVLQQKGQWLQIEHQDGDKGWVFDTLVW